MYARDICMGNGVPLDTFPSTSQNSLKNAMVPAYDSLANVAIHPEDADNLIAYTTRNNRVRKSNCVIGAKIDSHGVQRLHTCAAY